MSWGFVCHFNKVKLIQKEKYETSNATQLKQLQMQLQSLKAAEQQSLALAAKFEATLKYVNSQINEYNKQCREQEGFGITFLRRTNFTGVADLKKTHKALLQERKFYQGNTTLFQLKFCQKRNLLSQSNTDRIWIHYRSIPNLWSKSWRQPNVKW